MTKTCIIVSHTHWDREWYETFQQFRMRLVRLVDRLLHILDTDSTYRYFMLDGQTIVLDDYLQIRPEREADLRRHVQAGRLLIGPWHLLPDDFLVSGEALVHNLLLGDRTARRFGAKMRVGYIPDPFGHISQLPQILRGFGMNSAVLRRGLDDQPTELLWQASDGSTVLLCYLRDGYDNAARLPVQNAQAFVAEVRRLHDNLAPYAPSDHVLLMNGVDHMEPVPELPQAIAAAAALAPDLRLVHGTLPMYVSAVMQSLALDLDNLPLAHKRGYAELGPRPLETVRGELRSPKRHHLLPGVLSARMWIKQRNNQAQNLLEKWAEPFSALAGTIAAKAETPAGSTFTRDDAAAAPKREYTAATGALVWQAWKYLLENQPHDSICGCSIDQVHREMATRFDWAEQIGEEVTQQSLKTIAAEINTLAPMMAGGAPAPSLPPQPYIPLVVFNPLADARTDLVTAAVQVPGSLEQFAVVDERGQAVPHQVDGRQGADFASLELGREEILGLPGMVQMIATLGLSLQEIHVSVVSEHASVNVTLMDGGQTDAALLAEAQRQVEAALATGAQHFHVRAHKAATMAFHFVAHDVPGCGYRTYFLVARAPAAAPVASVDPHLENEFFAVDVDPADGTLTVLDKSTGATFTGLHRLVDGGDRGDEYNYCAPEADQLIATPSTPPTIAWVEQGPARWTLQVQQTLQLPAGLSADRCTRSRETVEVPVISQISLCPGVRRIDFRTEVDNRARDHRLRVHFPSPVHTGWSEAESAFDVVRRPLGVPSDTSDWVEQPVPTHPHKTFVDVTDSSVGLMVVNRGLPEYEVQSEVDGSVTVALTLLRSVGWLSRDDFPCRKGHAGPALETPEAQCLGRQVFEYAIVPHAGNWQSAYKEAHAFNAPLRAVSTDVHGGTLPLAQNLVSLQGEGGLVLSAVKTAEAGDGLIIRFYNLLGHAVVAYLRTYRPITSARLVNLAEEELRELTLDGPGLLRVAANTRQIVSVKLRMDP